MTLAAMTAAASQLDNAAPDDVEITDSSAAAEYIADGCLVDGPLGRVGLEMEAHCFDPADPFRRPSWEEITEVLEWLSPLPGGSVVSVEPGGAVELSGPPADGVLAAIGAMTRDQAVLRSALANAGLGLVFLGADPLRSPVRVNPGARYRAMEQFFAASHSGVPGAAMMTSTAAIQVNLDAGPQEGWAERVRLAHALGPTMIAIAANSPMLGGRFSGWQSTRQRVWGQMDSARCGPILGASGDHPGIDWAKYALKAPVMMVRSPDTQDTRAVTDYVPFTDWVDGRVLLDGRRATVADLVYHLTTLFPPVRPRQWLEIRYLDSVPDEVWPADAAAQHARHEAEVGGYVAAEAAAAVLDAGRAAVAALSGLPDAEVVFTTGSLHALDLLLGSWPGENRTLACLPGEYGPNLAVMAAHGFDVRPLPTLQDGRVALDDAAFMLADDPPDLVHLTVVASHRGVAQPLAMVAQLCTELKLPLVVDAAQGLGHVDCAVGADVTYASSRKWIAGPRGVGVLAVRPELMERLRARLPAPDWMPPLTVAQQLGFGEANVAARVGFSVALGEHLACGPQAIRARLAELGDIARTVLADVSGWRVVEAVDEPSAITTLAPIDGADPAAVRAWLLSQRRIVTTYAGVERAPLELPAPVLRISPHVDNTADDLDAFAEALVAATAATSGER